MLSRFAGFKIVVSKYCYESKTVVRGIADSRRPNGKKPLYRKVTIHIPLMYRQGDTIICAPEWEARVRKEFEKPIERQWDVTGLGW